MAYHLLADLVVVAHFMFVLFSLLGALLVIRWRKMMWLHLPAAVWAAGVEFSGKICPLTPLENWLRARGGEAGYAGDFIGQYLLWLLYPFGLTRGVQIILGAIVVGINIGIYGYVIFVRKSGAADSK
ncbi:MAG: DUF2784 domain-containing protein [Desulfobacterales bacterium]|jgi:hypothetical protein|nr:DUF2784 domain-containing protein [Desulfobacterales bacterium]MDH3827516.1 DUF2784 domain-containing protein [Desulfobacterales bacterium]MDH4010932.1 DUF2784 domain-containing protein [Desulfobacterales bacterium]